MFIFLILIFVNLSKNRSTSPKWLAGMKPKSDKITVQFEVGYSSKFCEIKIKMFKKITSEFDNILQG